MTYNVFGVSLNLTQPQLTPSWLYDCLWCYCYVACCHYAAHDAVIFGGMFLLYISQHILYIGVKYLSCCGAVNYFGSTSMKTMLKAFCIQDIRACSMCVCAR